MCGRFTNPDHLDPNRLMEPIHNRTPVFFAPAYYHRWMNTAPEDANSLQELLIPCPEGDLDAESISKLVNASRNDVPQCVQLIAES